MPCRICDGPCKCPTPYRELVGEPVIVPEASAENGILDGGKMMATGMIEAKDEPPFKKNEGVRHKSSGRGGLVESCERHVVHGKTRFVVHVSGTGEVGGESWWADDCEYFTTRGVPPIGADGEDIDKDLTIAALREEVRVAQESREAWLRVAPELEQLGLVIDPPKYLADQVLDFVKRVCDTSLQRRDAFNQAQSELARLRHRAETAERDRDKAREALSQLQRETEKQIGEKDAELRRLKETEVERQRRAFRDRY